jgi:hypothetical protein
MTRTVGAVATQLIRENHGSDLRSTPIRARRVRATITCMNKILTFLIVVVAAVVLAASASAQRSTTVTVVMKDPGCHWFSANGKFTTKLAVAGPVSLFNVDEAALKVAGPHGVKLDGVGKKLALAKGTYHITMVGQAPDDNHLLLVVR